MTGGAFELSRRQPQQRLDGLKAMAHPTGFEPVTSAFGGQAQAFEGICSSLSRPFPEGIGVDILCLMLLRVFELVSTWSLNGC